MPTPARHPTIAIVGATGAVGREFLDILSERNFPHGPIRLLASPRSAGTTLNYKGEAHTVQALTENSFDGIDLALFSAGGSVSKQYCPIAAAAGAIVVDNSSAFRMASSIALVVPEVNPEALAPAIAHVARSRAAHSRPGSHESGGGATATAILQQASPAAATAPGVIIANPNCSTIIMLLAVNPLRRAFGVDRLVISTYQAVSGAGAAAMDELREQTRAVLAGQAPEPRIFAEPCAFNVFSHNSAMNPETGRNVEEEKMVLESRKIWNDPTARITATCVRVPTFRAHAESINVTLSRPAEEAEVRAALAQAPGVQIVDDRANNRFPTPLKASGRDAALVGRIRPDESGEQIVSHGRRLYRNYDIFVCADQLRKGAALNAVQIAEQVFGF
jgi:aspartate-semialdehyde dehydrogenase